MNLAARAHGLGISLLLCVWGCGYRQGQDEVQRRRQQRSTQQTLEVYAEATQLFLGDCTNRSLVVTNLAQALLSNPGDPNWRGPYLKAEPGPVKDAYGTPIQIRMARGGSGFIVISAGSDGQFGTDDDLESLKELRGR